MMDVDRLNDLLAERGWHRKDLAQAAGITSSLLSRVINTSRCPSPQTRSRIVKALGLKGFSAAKLFDCK